jgi:hypothetical protein
MIGSTGSTRALNRFRGVALAVRSVGSASRVGSPRCLVIETTIPAPDALAGAPTGTRPSIRSQVEQRERSDATECPIA